MVVVDVVVVGFVVVDVVEVEVVPGQENVATAVTYPPRFSYEYMSSYRDPVGSW